MWWKNLFLNAITCFICSYIIEQQSCFLTLTEVHFSKKTAYAFLDDLAQVALPSKDIFGLFWGALWELELLCQEFHNQYGHKINTATRPYSFIEFDTYIQVVIQSWYGKGCGSKNLFYLIQKAKKTYSDSRGRRNLNNLNTELQDVQRIMVQVLRSLLAAVQSWDWAFLLQNIDDVLQRGAVLSEMENKSQNLTEMSRKYRFNCQSSRNCLLLERVAPQI